MTPISKFARFTRCCTKVSGCLVGCIEDLRRFSGISANRDLEAGDNQSLKFKWRGGELKFLSFILNIFKAFQILDTGLQISQALKTFVSSFGNTRNFCSTFETMSFQEYVSKGIALPHSVYYGDLFYIQTKKGQTHSEFHHGGLENN